eukprot:COSAG06_NODE_48078_length_334_cov_1.927660_1_plen_25_part_10
MGSDGTSVQIQTKYLLRPTLVYKPN